MRKKKIPCNALKTKESFLSVFLAGMDLSLAQELKVTESHVDRNQDHLPRPDWSPYYADLLSHLEQSAGGDRNASLTDEDADDTQSTEESTDYQTLDWLDERSIAQSKRSRRIDANDESRRQDRARNTAHPEQLMLLAQTAAVIGSEQAFIEEFLAPGAVTVLSGMNLRQVSSLQYLLSSVVLPDDWLLKTCAAPGADEQRLLLCLPECRAYGSISSSAIEAFCDRISSGLACVAHPLLILLPDGVELPDSYKQALPHARRMPLLDKYLMLSVLEAIYGPDDASERQVIFDLLPDDQELKKLSYPSHLLALRSPSARDAARKMAKLAQRTSQRSGSLTLEDIKGTSPAHLTATGIAIDIQACKAGTAAWAEIPRSLLLYGEPGVGKTVLARAIAASAGIPIIIASAGEWQSKGHLGDMLRAMLTSFSEAAAQRPCILFLDEIDSFGKRVSEHQHNGNYRRQVINALLREIDKFLALDGSILLGACNSPEILDAAILRPGRFDLHRELTRPPVEQITHMLQRVFPNDDGVQELARLFVGCSPAQIDATIRSARSSARGTGIVFDASHLVANLTDARSKSRKLLWRIAVHESGHALLATMLGADPVERIVITNDGGKTTRRSAIIEGTEEEFEREFVIHLGGRAAERLVCGTISAGSGGGQDSDLARATQQLLKFDRQLGLGVNGVSWLGEADMSRLSEKERERVRSKLGHSEKRAAELLAPHRELLQQLAQELLRAREMDAATLRPWLGSLGDGKA